MNQPRTFWQSGVLHFVLVLGSLVFALPYFWLVGTSWKLDKEVQSEEVSILPQRPIARLNSPYVDERHFPELVRPEDVGRHRWEQWMRAAVTRELGRVADEWIATEDPRISGLDRDALRRELIEGLFQRLRGVLPFELWDVGTDEATFTRAVAERITANDVPEMFTACYRYFAVGKVLLKDESYRIHALTGDEPADSVWEITEGSHLARVIPQAEAGRPVALIAYDFPDTTLDTPGVFEVAALLDMPVDFDEWKRLSISFRRDQTWHELRILLEMDGRLLRSVAPKYLGEDTWWDVNLQEPGPDDQRMTARNYVLVREVERAARYDHGPGKMKLRLRLGQSKAPEAYWAKGTENYRKAFEQVPFWRYFKTSVFLVIANIVGTALSCSLAAFAFARLRWPGRDLCFILVLATMMIPPQVTMIPSFVIYKYLGWYNTLAPLWVPNLLAVNAFAIFLLRQAMKGIPADLEEAAQIDGCGWWRIYWSVALPLMRPTIAAISIFTFMFVWNDFMTPLIYVNDQRLYPLALGLFSFLAGRENQFTLIMAGSMIMTLPVILTFFFAQRHFIQGVTMSGMKN
jgi:multiple sugar transport system permease protein